jgi:hypothetical protein
MSAMTVQSLFSCAISWSIHGTHRCEFDSNEIEKVDNSSRDIAVRSLFRKISIPHHFVRPSHDEYPVSFFSKSRASFDMSMRQLTEARTKHRQKDKPTENE